MKKVINRKLYDTTTAREVGYYWNGLGTSDFHSLTETLYQKKTGEFFLHGEGGGLTQYAERYPDGRGYGEQIVPLTYDEAADWAERHMDADAYQQVFGEITEDDDEQDLQISFRLPASAVDKLRRTASQTGRTQQQILADLIATLEV